MPLRTVITLWDVFCIMLYAAQFKDIFYYTTPDNQYVRSPLFSLMVAPLAMVMIINTVRLIRRRKKLSKRVFIALLVYLLPTTILIILYMFAAVDTLVSFWIALCAITMFSIILTDNMAQYIQQQREIANQRAGIMALQMRPHFTYDTIMGIYYLRRNFAAIASESTVPLNRHSLRTDSLSALILRIQCSGYRR